MKFKLKTRDYWLLGAALALVVLFGFLANPAVHTVEGEVAKDIEKDRARFSPTNSLDIAMAMKLVTHAPPRPLAPPEPSPVTLLYPPSASDLEKLFGSSIKMSSFKYWLLVFLVGMAFLTTGLGGLQDMLGIKLPMSREHGWNDGIFLMLTAILVAVVLK